MKKQKNKKEESVLENIDPQKWINLQKLGLLKDIKISSNILEINEK